MKKIGFIDFYLDEWHANNYPAWIQEASGGELEVAYAYAVIDSPKGGLSTDGWCKKYGITRCYSMEEVVEKSDCLIVLSPDNAEMHEGLCQLPLRSGKPTYVDKTFAPDGDTARRIFAVAEGYGTPCYSSSALRYAAEYRDICRYGVTAVTSVGPSSSFETYCIHQLEPIMMLIDSPVEKVMYIPAERSHTVLLSFADGRQASMTGFLDGAAFTLNVAAEGGNSSASAKSDFFHEFILELCDFLQTGEEKVSHEETIRIMDVRGAAIRAEKTPFQWVSL